MYHHARWKLEWGCSTFNLLGIEFSVDLKQIVDLNYNIQVPKIKALIQHWKRRILTPIGRVTVVKSLLLPILNHLFIALPNPNNDILSSLNNCFFEFIWNSKIDKVKRQTVTQDYLKGGLKMVDVKHFILSLKCTWIKRLTNSHKPWLDIFLAVHGNKVVEKLLDFGDKYIYTILNHSNDFWSDVFQSWLPIVRIMNNDVLLQNHEYVPVWYNTNICVGNECIYINTWYQHGVKIIADFLDEDGNFLLQEEFTQKFRLIDICTMQYNSIISSISKFLNVMSVKRSEVKKKCFPYIPLYFKPILLNKKCSKVLYDMINSNNIIPKAIQKWNTELTPHLENNISTKELFKVCFKTTMDTQVQWLQYRIIHKFIPTKCYLKKINVISDNLCSFCKGDVETIQHMFLYCPNILTLWSDLSLHIFRNTTKRIGFNIINVILGEMPLSVHNKVVNFIILYTKQYIFYCSKQNKRPNINELVHYLFFKYKVEKFVTIKSCGTSKFEKLWENWKNIFDT